MSPKALLSRSSCGMGPSQFKPGFTVSLILIEVPSRLGLSCALWCLISYSFSKPLQGAFECKERVSELGICWLFITVCLYLMSVLLQYSLRTLFKQPTTSCSAPLQEEPVNCHHTANHQKMDAVSKTTIAFCLYS